MVVKTASTAVAVNGAAKEATKLLEERLSRGERQALERMLKRDLSGVTEGRRVEEYAKWMATAKVHELGARALNCSRGDEFRIVTNLVERASTAAFEKIRADIKEFREFRLEESSEEEEVVEEVGASARTPNKRRQPSHRRERNAKRWAPQHRRNNSPPAEEPSSLLSESTESEEEGEGEEEGNNPAPQKQNRYFDMRDGGPSKRAPGPSKRVPGGADRSRNPLLFHMDAPSLHNVKSEKSSAAPGGENSSSSGSEYSVDEEGTDCTEKIVSYVADLTALLQFPMKLGDVYKVAAYVLMLKKVHCTKMKDNICPAFFKEFRDLMMNIHGQDGVEEVARETQRMMLEGLLEAISSQRKRKLFDENFAALKNFKAAGPSEPRNEERALVIVPNEDGDNIDLDGERSHSDSEPPEPVLCSELEDFFNQPYYP